MSATNSLHYQLCCKGAEYLLKMREPFQSKNKWATVEIITQGIENPDVYATNGTTSTVIEVKTSHQDFLNDKDKYCRSTNVLEGKKQLGNYHYYLCPTNVISKDELPSNWGLLYYENDKVTKVVPSPYVDNDKVYDFYILSSIMRRELGVGKIFNYRNNKVKKYGSKQ